MMKKGFTLLELIVVLVIIGILATLGLTQYGRMVERARGAEAKMILGDMRNLAFAYRLANGTITGITGANLNIGPAADQIPDSCRSTHYFRYYVDNGYADPYLYLDAFRCNSGGKDPQGPAGTHALYLWVDLTGQTPDRWEHEGDILY